jgi:hypothetical protein
MYKSLIFIFQVLLVTQVVGQNIDTNKTDSIKEEIILLSACDREDLQGDLFGGEFDTEYNLYTSNPEVMMNLGLYNGDYNIIIVLGSWCSDSREQVPRFLRIIDELGLSDDIIRMIAVDRTKSPGMFLENEVADLNIERVPTFIIMNEGIEIGRIIETPEETLEADLLKILQNLFK